MSLFCLSLIKTRFTEFQMSAVTPTTTVSDGVVVVKLPGT